MQLADVAAEQARPTRKGTRPIAVSAPRFETVGVAGNVPLSTLTGERYLDADGARISGLRAVAQAR